MPMLQGEYKICSKCKVNKLIICFSKCKTRKDGYNYSCKMCENSRISLYKSQHKDEIKQKYHEYYITHKEQENKRVSIWQKQNAVKNCEKVKRYYKTHKEIVNQARRIRRQTEEGRMKVMQENHLRRTRTLKTVNDLSTKDISLLLKIQDNKCGCCGIEFTHLNKYTIDHIVPVKLGGALTLKNAQLLCRRCNSSKGAKVIRYISDLHLSGG